MNQSGYLVSTAHLLPRFITEYATTLQTSLRWRISSWSSPTVTLLVSSIHQLRIMTEVFRHQTSPNKSEAGAINLKSVCGYRIKVEVLE